MLYNKNSKMDVQLLKQVQPEDVARYLEANDFVKQGTQSDKNGLNNGILGDKVNIYTRGKTSFILPLSGEFADYPQRIAQIILGCAGEGSPEDAFLEIMGDNFSFSYHMDTIKRILKKNKSGDFSKWMEFLLKTQGNESHLISKIIETIMQE